MHAELTSVEIETIGKQIRQEGTFAISVSTCQTL